MKVLVMLIILAISSVALADTIKEVPIESEIKTYTITQTQTMTAIDGSQVDVIVGTQTTTKARLERRLADLEEEKTQSVANYDSAITRLQSLLAQINE